MSDDEHQRRRATDSIPWLNGKAAQIEAIFGFVNKVALGPLVVIVILAMVAGLLDSPIMTVVRVLGDHDMRAVKRDEELARALNTIVDKLQALNVEQAKTNRWVNIRQCVEFRDGALQAQCFSEWGARPGGPR